MAGLPRWVERFDWVGGTGTRGAERAALLAAIRWANRDGSFYPAVATWARLAGLSIRGLQNAIKRLLASGLLEAVRHSRGGPSKTTVYRVPAWSDNSARDAGVGGVGPRTACGVERLGTQHQQREPPHHVPPNPARRDAEPRTACGGTEKEQTEEPTTNGDGVVASLSRELRSNPNLTAERRAFIERVAPTKKNPPGWAADNIRNGYQVPGRSREALQREQKDARDRWIKDFPSLPEELRRELLADARVRCPGLANCDDTDRRLLCAAKMVYDERRGCRMATRAVPCRDGSIDESD